MSDEKQVASIKKNSKADAIRMIIETAMRVDDAHAGLITFCNAVDGVMILIEGYNTDDDGAVFAIDPPPEIFA